MNDAINQVAKQEFQWLTQLPWLLLALIALPLVLAAWRSKIYPTRWWIAWVGLAVALSLFTVFAPAMIIAVGILDGLVITVAAVDYLLLYLATNDGIHVSRELPRTCSLGVPVASELTVENGTLLTLSGEVCDDLPEHFTASPNQHTLRLPPRGRMTAHRKMTPTRRGAFELEYVYMGFLSPLRLWNRQLRLELHNRLNVYPDMKQLSDYALLARTNRLSLIGVRRTRRIGQDSDFERLRDYSRDDNYRHIDWRSTARRHKLTVRQFQSDQSQRVMFLLDCGRMMTNERDGYSLLDHALNSVLMMSYVALSQGDAVGMLCFSDTIHAFIPPRGGSSQMNRLIQAGFDQFPRLVESRYDQAFLYLSTHCKRRSLVVLTTNVIDEVNGAAVVDYLTNLSGHHLPLGVLLRDHTMFDAADSPSGSRFSMYRSAAAADILLWRHQVLKDLEHRGVLVVDAFPDELTAPLVNQYLEIKAKHLL
ncbi:DUF58 domain-containing protein [Novipirellula artificiosorum]|uniref:DUF58 domain-containing protein n=1 Tax=Novipirellula artificiosorum TaxID=2528016 RepID=A0A5C6DWH7_9BACT|nr:DUF58 domain-containing protein [Novipirellula artificiosorum]TWU41753.1 hypothetical protein Poly41_00450 [Novipirellula artificiosorum]